jgi:ankyrin repeat protein
LAAGYIDIVRYLVDGMASIDLLTGEKETPASIAAEHGHFGVVRHLVAHGASVDAKRVRPHPRMDCQSRLRSHLWCVR